MITYVNGALNVEGNRVASIARRRHGRRDNGETAMIEIDWDDAYANMPYVPGAEALPAQWAAQAEAFRASGVTIDTVRYGPAPRCEMDILSPVQRCVGLMIFVHGGYWMKFDRSYWTHLAKGALDRGWAVAIPSYTLAPEARVAQMTAEIGAAINHAAQIVPGPIRLAGHSAGGHLVSRMICTDTTLPQDVQDRIGHTVSISGLHDLRPLLWTKLNATLNLDADEAVAESAALATPRPGVSVTAWVGGDERPEFIRQAQALDVMWSGLGAQTACVVEPGHNHFSVVEALMDAKSPLLNEILDP